MGGIPEYDYIEFFGTGGGAATARDIGNRPEAQSKPGPSPELTVLRLKMQRQLLEIENELELANLERIQETDALNYVIVLAPVRQAFANLLNFWPAPVHRQVSVPASTIEEDLAAVWMGMFSQQTDWCASNAGLLK
jgi:hypothetical protein